MVDIKSVFPSLCYNLHLLLVGFQWACCFEIQIPSVFATLVNWFLFVALGYLVPWLICPL